MMRVNKAAPQNGIALESMVVLVLQAILTLPAQSQDFSCPMPLAIPDAWDDLNSNGEFDEDELYDPLGTGYGPDDVGQPLTLSFHDSPGPPRFGAMFPVDFPAINRGNPITGSAAFGMWLVECSPFELANNDSLLLEPGAKTDTTLAAFSGFINQDPGAYWDEASESVQGSNFPESPRVVTILAYDPEVPLSVRTFVILAKFLSFFVEGIGPGSRITGRILEAGTDVPTPITPTTWGTLKARY